MSEPGAAAPKDAAAPERGGANAWRALAATSVVLFAVLAADAAWDSSVTADELAHIPTAVHLWRTGDTSLYGKSPPLLRWLIGAATAPLAPVLPDVAPASQRDGWYPWELGVRFADVNAVRYPRIVAAARLPSLLMGVATLLFVYRWGRVLIGERGAAIATLLGAFSPALLAHAGLATTDAGGALTFVAALAAMHSLRMRPSPLRVVVAGLALGLALASKYTAILLLALIPLAVWRVVPGRRLAVSVRRAILVGGSLVVVTLTVVAAAFGFRGLFIARPGIALGLPLPIPVDLLQGLADQLLDARLGEFASYLLGRWSNDGFPGYFVVALLLTTPLATLVLLAVSAWGWRRPRAAPPGVAALLWGVPGLFLLATANSRLDVGVRYLMPILPLLWLAAARAAEVLLLEGRAGRYLLAASVLASVGSVAHAHPGYLGYFNELVSLRAGELPPLLDSNVDWGQDLIRLRHRLARDGIASIGLWHFGSVDPAIYGIRSYSLPDRPEPGLYAVSLNFVAGMTYPCVRDGRLDFREVRAREWLRSLRPIEQVGTSVWLYRVDPGSAAADGAVTPKPQRSSAVR